MDVCTERKPKDSQTGKADERMDGKTDRHRYGWTNRQKDVQRFLSYYQNKYVSTNL